MKNKEKFKILESAKRIRQITEWFTEDNLNVTNRILENTAKYGYITGFQYFESYINITSDVNAIYVIVESFKIYGKNRVLKTLYKDLINKNIGYIQQENKKRKNDLQESFKRNNRVIYIKTYIINNKAIVRTIDKQTGKFVKLPKKYNINIEIEK